MAGGDVKPGVTFGATDEWGYRAVENPLQIHDLHATILHLLGINHEKLTYRFSGRDIRLPDGPRKNRKGDFGVATPLFTPSPFLMGDCYPLV